MFKAFVPNPRLTGCGVALGATAFFGAKEKAGFFGGATAFACALGLIVETVPCCLLPKKEKGSGFFATGAGAGVGAAFFVFDPKKEKGSAFFATGAGVGATFLAGTTFLAGAGFLAKRGFFG